MKCLCTQSQMGAFLGVFFTAAQRNHFSLAAKVKRIYQQLLVGAFYSQTTKQKTEAEVS